MDFLEATVSVLYGTLHLHADGTYRLEPPFHSHDIPWPRRVRIKLPVTRPEGSTLPPIERFDAALYADGTYRLEPPT